MTSILAASLACAAVAQTAPSPAPLRLRAPAFSRDAHFAPHPAPFADKETPLRRTDVRIALSERVELVASGSKEKTPGDWTGRRADGPAGRPRTARAARLGLMVRW